MGALEEATPSTRSAAAGEPVTKGTSPELPAEIATAIPARTIRLAAWAVAGLLAKSAPIDRLMASTRSSIRPSLFGSVARSIAAIMARPLQRLTALEQTL